MLLGYVNVKRIYTIKTQNILKKTDNIDMVILKLILINC
jgi:hypothetical protein